MKKSVLFLSFVAMIAMWSCGAKSNNGESTRTRQYCDGAEYCK